MSKQKYIINMIIDDIKNNKENLSLDSLIIKYTDYSPKLVNEIAIELAKRDYEIISVNPIIVKKR